jgi:hypothetical protein
MGCLFAIFAGVFPRLAVLIVWIARPERIDAAFDTFLLPLLAIISCRSRPLSMCCCTPRVGG